MISSNLEKWSGNLRNIILTMKICVTFLYQTSLIIASVIFLFLSTTIDYGALLPLQRMRSGYMLMRHKITPHYYCTSYWFLNNHSSPHYKPSLMHQIRREEYSVPIQTVCDT